ncbi:MAG: prolyl oligopeptidase family serine peptidase, partial [Halobacteria archaeon]|nr:prolyl oligopeptidase family serine peptidase [Halobacteria archaeon]
TDVYYKHESSDEFEPLVTGEDAIFHPRIHRDKVYLRTSHEAPNYRVIVYDLDERGDSEEVIPEDTNGILKTIETVGDRIIAQYERDAVSEMDIYTLDGERITHVDLPEHGTVTGLNGREESDEFFFQFESFNQPPTVYRYDIPDNELEVINQQDVEIKSDIVVKQEWYESKDGTEVPMFIIHKKGIELDGDNPTLVHGYGGFEISITPSFDKYRLPFVEDGGVFAQPNLRGGGEFGEEWHHAAMHDKKQNTFDDMISAVEYLIQKGYTRKDRVGIMGGSNGGLTVGAVVTQRSDLVKACFCSVPLLDMLRFHKFLLGESWTTEYGSPENEEDYEYIKEYSPYHNVNERNYPAVMFKTAESDTRVHPAHARKMTALMQERNTSDNPIILRTETSTGHGVGKPISKIVEEELDQWCFLYDQLGVNR